MELIDISVEESDECDKHKVGLCNLLCLESKHRRLEVRGSARPLKESCILVECELHRTLERRQLGEVPLTDVVVQVSDDQDGCKILHELEGGLFRRNEYLRNESDQHRLVYLAQSKNEQHNPEEFVLWRSSCQYTL